MARGDWGMSGRYSYKRATLVVCCINAVVAVYVLRSLYASLYIYPLGEAQTNFKYTLDQIRKMEESNQIRREAEPRDLIKLVVKLKKRVMREERVELPKNLRLKLIDGIRNRLRSLDSAANTTQQHEAVAAWRKEQLEEAKKVRRGETLNSTILQQEAGIIEKALNSDWFELAEEIGLWIPTSVITREHDDKPEGEDDFEKGILPGRQLPTECHAELHTDYGGAAIRWGLTHRKESAYDCCMACLDQARLAKAGQRKCNIWVYCPSESGCYSPDIYNHKYQECWLKHSERPEVSFKETYSEAFRNAHARAPVVVPWASGVVAA